MTLEDLKRLATGSLLFSLDRIIAPRLINILYLLGLAAIALWSISHFFATFRYGFGTGLWGLVEIFVFGLLGFVVLRIACEAVIVFFKTNERAARDSSRPRPANSLIDEVRDAIEELAEHEQEDEAKDTVHIDPEPENAVAKRRSSSAKAASSSRSSRKPPKRTAGRTPPKKSS